ncbi:MAG: SDR family oxidoreductase [Bacteroidales bacterium]
MNILLTGVTGYIGGRMLPLLLAANHQVYCLIRDIKRMPEEYRQNPQIHLIEGDLVKGSGLAAIPEDLDVAYYLVHSMSGSTTHFLEDELQAATNFVNRIKETRIRQVIYLSGFDHEKNLSKHLESRKETADILKSSDHFAVTVLHAGIVIGSGSASFEIISDLVEKLPVMLVPEFMENKCQPIAVRDVLFYLTSVLGNENTYNRDYDIGGPDILSYKEMLLHVAKVRGLKRHIFVFPIIRTRLCANWLYFVTSTSYKLALNLTESMKNNTICAEHLIQELFPRDLLNYDTAVQFAYEKEENDDVFTSWRDSFSSSGINWKINDRIHIPKFGVYKHIQDTVLEIPVEEALDRIWQTGGENGWWYANWLWRLRGFLDLFDHGVGIKRGRTHKTILYPGETVDFWRVLVADKNEKRLLLYAEMWMPGEGWLDFKIISMLEGPTLRICATMRPKGIPGRLYWYMTLPFHDRIFTGMGRKLAKK